MQHYGDKGFLYSASDLLAFLECQQTTFFGVRSLTEDIATTETTEQDILLRNMGLAHEKIYLQKLKSKGLSVAEISKDAGLEARVAETIKAMQSAYDVIYQAVFFEDTHADMGVRGDADFLRKINKPSRLGDYSYEVLDTKLGKSVLPKYIIQLCVYTELVEAIQGERPEMMHLVLGDEQEYSFKVDDFFYYYQHLKPRFKNYLKHLLATPDFVSKSDPCHYCDSCRWRNNCSAQWDADDNLSLIANIRRDDIEKLRQKNINTVAELANIAPDTKVPKLNSDTFKHLRNQAILQNYKKCTGKNKYKLLTAKEGQGFERLPRPNLGDLFFDMEGDPLYDRGLEYLFGIVYLESTDGAFKPKDKHGLVELESLKDCKEVFKPFWAHDHAQEEQAFRQFMAFVEQHLKTYPQAYIYHYNHYETTALKRLAGRYSACEEQLDNLLRHKKFVDLYRVVHEGLQVSSAGYSIKDLEVFYMDKRDGAIASGSDSIAAYNRWRAEEAAQITTANKTLADIAYYNQLDCSSTYQLRNWLLEIKPEHLNWIEVDVGDESSENVSKRKDWEIEYEDYQNKLTSAVGSEYNAHLVDFLEFHQRENKPQWWRMFARQNYLDSEIIDDLECIGAMKLQGEPYQEKRSLIYSYKFPEQEYKIKVNSSAIDVSTMASVGTVVDLDNYNHIVKIKRGANQEPLQPSLSIGPPQPINTAPLRSSLYRLADQVLAGQQKVSAYMDILVKASPRIANKLPDQNIVKSDDLLGDALSAVQSLQNSYLIIQGPPGAGKTHISAHIIVALMKQGKKVGITSNSHKAIHNLIAKIETVAKQENFGFNGVKISSSSNQAYYSSYQDSTKDNNNSNNKVLIENTSAKKVDFGANLFAATAWPLSSTEFAGKLDYLFIDEAGQVSTANVLSMSGATKNIILVGDQMQLSYPSQGTHPGDAACSILEYILGERATIKASEGVFLNQTYRLHPDICGFISKTFYDGLLKSNAEAAHRHLTMTNSVLPNSGIAIIFAEHQYCSQKSVEEGAIIKDKYAYLLRQQFIDKHGTQRKLRDSDIMVVAPYNMQVDYLLSVLPTGAQVGTVDNFQGQEAPIVILSMTASSIDNLPRGVEFLYSANRLNVALSRAQCLAIVVMSPMLLEAPCQTVEQMRLVNTFCRLADYATHCPA